MASRCCGRLIGSAKTTYFLVPLGTEGAGAFGNFLPHPHPKMITLLGSTNSTGV